MLDKIAHCWGPNFGERGEAAAVAISALLDAGSCRSCSARCGALPGFGFVLGERSAGRIAVFDEARLSACSSAHPSQLTPDSDRPTVTGRMHWRHVSPISVHRISFLFLSHGCGCGGAGDGR